MRWSDFLDPVRDGEEVSRTRFAPEPITASAYDRLHRTSRRREPRPARGLKYEIFPDEQADHVERLAGERAHVMDMLRDAPFGDFQIPVKAEPPKIELVYQALLDRLKRQVPEFWHQLRAAETLLDEAAASFGEDPALREVRAIVVWLREELTDLHAKLTTEYDEEIELGEPNDQEIEVLRKIAGWPKSPTSAHTINVRLSC